MIFKGIHPQTGQTLWGCPDLMKPGRWIIEWFDPNGIGDVEGETNPTTQELLWIESNISAVDAMQAKCAAWRQKIDGIPF